MNVLVTGAKGFIGKNLCAGLKNIKDGKDKTHPGIVIDEVFEFDRENTLSELDEFCQKADFVFNFAGVNRPEKSEDFFCGNVGFSEDLIALLKKHRNLCPVVFSSSVQASLSGRYNCDYGKSKREAENLFFEYSLETGAKVLVYRFPNVFGKWCKPDYNSAVATFCSNIANDLPVSVTDENIELELLYIDDLVAEMIGALENKERRCEFEGTSVIPKKDGKFCFVPAISKATLGEIVGMLKEFKSQPVTLFMPEMPSGSLKKKLYSAYISYLPKEKTAVPLKTNADPRGSFTELLKTEKCGQFSVNRINPKEKKGEHWHNGKWEIFIVLSGTARISERKIGTSEVREFIADGKNPTAVYMLPGYTHNIENLSETDDLITLIWANEPFDRKAPDTFYEAVK